MGCPMQRGGFRGRTRAEAERVGRRGRPRYTGPPMRWPERHEAELSQRYSGAHACVTGGAGFIGAHLVEALLDLGASVSVVDDLSTGDPDLIAALVDRDPERVRFIPGSILDTSALDDGFERASIVFHLAAVSSVQRALHNPERTFDVNARGTVEVCQAARIARVERVVNASTAAVYGEPDGVPTGERAELRPTHPYAASKLASEHVCAAWAHAYELDAVSLRFFNVYGPRQSADSDDAAAIASFASRARRDEAPVIYGDGSQTRDFLFVRDAALAVLLAGAAPDRLRGRAVNIGSGKATDIASLARAVCRAAGRPDLRPEHAPARPADLPRSQADISLAGSLLGFTPTVELDEGLRRTLDPSEASVRESA